MKEPGSYEERHGRACELFGRCVPGVEPARCSPRSWPRWGQEGELAFHVPAGLAPRPHPRPRSTRSWCTCALYAGFPKVVDGMRAVRAAFAKIDARAAERGPR